jgi:hypothetical protein
VILVGLLAIVAEQDPRTLPVARAMKGLTTAMGLVLIGVVATHLVRHYQQIDVRTTVLSFVQPLALSAAILLLSYVVALLAWYELAFMRIRWDRPSKRHGWKAKAALLLTLNVDVHKIHNFSGTLPRRLARTTSWGAARAFVRRYKVEGISPFESEA